MSRDFHVQLHHSVVRSFVMIPAHSTQFPISATGVIVQVQEKETAHHHTVASDKSSAG